MIKRILSQMMTIICMIFLLSSFASASTTEYGAYLGSSQIVVPIGSNTFDVDLFVASDVAFSSADFGIALEGNLELKEVIYSQAITASKVSILEKNKINYFGFYGTKNDYNGNLKICTLRFTYTGNQAGTVVLHNASLTKVVSTTDAKKVDLSVNGELKISRQVSGGGTSGDNSGSTTTPIAQPIETVLDDEILPEGLVSVNFLDIQSSWAKGYIEFLASRGIVKGISDTRYAPDVKITRADFTKLLIGVLNEGTKPSSGFLDVNSKDYFYDAVNTAASLGLILGHNQYFHPREYITREDMSVILYRALQYKKITLSVKGDLTVFSDANQISSYAVSSLSYMVGEGILQGHQGKIRPKDYLTRAEAAKVLYMLYQMLQD